MGENITRREFIIRSAAGAAAAGTALPGAAQNIVADAKASRLTWS